MASARPPRNGPTSRHFIPSNKFSLIAGAGVALGDEAICAGFGEGLAAKAVAQNKANVDKTSEGKRPAGVFIRVRWEGCSVLQLESANRWGAVTRVKERPGFQIQSSRLIASRPERPVVLPVASAPREGRREPRRARPVSNQREAPFPERCVANPKRYNAKPRGECGIRCSVKRRERGPGAT